MSLPASFKYKIDTSHPSTPLQPLPPPDNSIRIAGLRYTLREWRRWTRDIIELESGIFLTRAEYTTELVSYILSVLGKHGYSFIHTSQSLSRRLMHHWLNIYRSSTKYSLLPINDNDCSQEEYEEWQELFPAEFWAYMTDDYITYGAFDDSDMGINLLGDLSAFFWLYVDPNKSDKIVKRREEIAKINSELSTALAEEYHRRVEALPAKKTESDRE